MPGTEWEERIVGFDEFAECSNPHQSKQTCWPLNPSILHGR